MTRFDEVARLRELAIRAKKVERMKDGNVLSVDTEYVIESYRSSFWLLEAAACFQPGDAALMGEILLLHREFEKDFPDENPGWSDLFARMEKAAAIMEELE